MPIWRNRPSMPKVRASSGTIGTTLLADVLVLEQRRAACARRPWWSRSRARRCLRAASRRLPAAGSRSGGAVRRALRQIAAERGAPLVQVAHLVGLSPRGLRNGSLPSSSSGTGMLKRSRNAFRSSSSSFFCWCATIWPSPPLPSPKPLTVLARITVGWPLWVRGRGVGRVHLLRIVAAAVQAPDLLVGHVGDHGLELGVLAEEMLAGVGAALGLEVLVLAVDAFLHHPAQQPLVVARQQRIPARAPQHLDDVPAGAEECRLELLDDLAVAAHRTVEALQVAVDDEDEVVEPLAHRHGERAHRLGLVHLAVAEERPDLADPTAVTSPRCSR